MARDGRSLSFSVLETGEFSFEGIFWVGGVRSQDVLISSLVLQKNKHSWRK